MSLLPKLKPQVKHSIEDFIEESKKRNLNLFGFQGTINCHQGGHFMVLYVISGNENSRELVYKFKTAASSYWDHDSWSRYTGYVRQIKDEILRKMPLARTASESIYSMRENW